MFRLMKNEIIKLLKKKSFYVVTFIFILFCILTNVVYKNPLDSSLTEEVDINQIEDENQHLDLDNSDDLLIYVENLTTLKVEEFMQLYSNNVATYLIKNNLYSIIYKMYESKYILEDDQLYQKYSLEVDHKILKIKNNDWHYFLDERILYLEERVSKTTGTENERYKALLEISKISKRSRCSL